MYMIVIVLINAPLLYLPLQNKIVMALHEIMVTQCANNVKVMLVASSTLSVISCVHFHEKYFFRIASWDLHFVFFNGYYDMIVNM
jgi:hypothetical protein